MPRKEPPTGSRRTARSRSGTGELATGGVVAAGGGVPLLTRCTMKSVIATNPTNRPRFITGAADRGGRGGGRGQHGHRGLGHDRLGQDGAGERGLGQGAVADFVTVAALAATVGFSSPCSRGLPELARTASRAGSSLRPAYRQ